MRRAKVWPLFVVGACAAVLARCSSGSGGDGPTPACEADLSALVGTGPGARAVVAKAPDLLQGEAAGGRAGDVLLANDRVRVVIEAPNRTLGPQPFGGNIIDADVVRADGSSRDRFGELGAFFNFGRTVDVERVEIVRDGEEGGAAVVAATGRDAVLDFINLRGLVGQFLPGLQLPDADADLGLRITTYYVLAPGSNAVHVVQAFCNDREDPVAMGHGVLVDSGGEVEIYGGRSGFNGGGGFGSLQSSLGATPGEPFVGWIGADVSYGLVPAQDLNQVVTISGVTTTLDGANALLDYTNGPDAPPAVGALIVDPKSKVTVRRDFVVAAEPGAIYGHWRRLRGTPVGTLSGRVSNAEGAPAAGARVFVGNARGISSLFITDADGRYAGLVPIGDHAVSADDDVGRTGEQAITIAAGEKVAIDLVLPARARLVLSVKDAAGGAIPAKVTVVCQGACPASRSGDDARRYRDVNRDRLPKTPAGETFSYTYLGPDGRATIDVPSAKLRVFVSRGGEWSLFDERVEPAPGETVTLEPVLRHVVDTTGWMSGDLHVHAINSPDSPVPNVERLRTFMAEGTDVIVSTDHDFITDFAPVLAQLPGGDAHLATITGVELTTFDYGHYNAFPLARDASKRSGGAVDWAGGKGAGLTIGEIFQKLHAFEGDQVVQLNHARGGFFSATALDTRTLWSRGDPKLFRIAGLTKDPATGDTRMFDDRFTAMEIQNGFGDGWIPLLNDWMSFLSRGLRRTGTAVSDTHKRHGDSGVPRTYVNVGGDDPRTLDPQAFARAVNAGKAYGTNGPVLRVTASAGAATAGLGDTIVGGEITFTAEVETPEWMEVDALSFYANATGTETNALGAAWRELPAAAKSFVLSPEVKDVGGRRVRLARVEWTGTFPKDAWVLAIVTGSKDMFPVVGKGDGLALAFTNPIYVDVAGDGWTPPVDLAAERARIGSLEESLSQPLSAPATEADLRRVLESDACHPGEH